MFYLSFYTWNIGIFFFYDSARLIWFGSLYAYKLDLVDFPNFLLWWEALLIQSRLEPKSSMFITLGALTLWHIWKECNQCVFDKVAPDAFKDVSWISLNFSILQHIGIFTAPSSQVSHLVDALNSRPFLSLYDFLTIVMSFGRIHFCQRP